MVQRAAAAGGVSEQDWSDRLVAEAWQPVLRTVDAANDDFIRTTQPRHRTGVQLFWERGWELHVEEVGVTQVRTLARAEQQVRDLVETMTGAPAADAEVVVVPELGDLRGRLDEARALTARAGAAQRQAAAATRAVVRDLRAAGLSTADVAALMHVSRGRVAQLG